MGPGELAYEKKSQDPCPLKNVPSDISCDRSLHVDAVRRFRACNLYDARFYVRRFATAIELINGVDGKSFLSVIDRILKGLTQQVRTVL